MSDAEFSRVMDVRQVKGKAIRLEASEAERKALATRFALVAVERLEADLILSVSGRAISAKGNISAQIVQPCAISGEDLPVTIAEPAIFRFVPETIRMPGDEEIELDADACDEVEYSGTQIDLGEAVAQSLGLAIDPYLAGPQAEAARRRAGLLDEGDAGPFAALKALRKEF